MCRWFPTCTRAACCMMNGRVKIGRCSSHGYTRIRVAFRCWTSRTLWWWSIRRRVPICSANQMPRKIRWTRTLWRVELLTMRRRSRYFWRFVLAHRAAEMMGEESQRIENVWWLVRVGNLKVWEEIYPVGYPHFLFLHIQPFCCIFFVQNSFFSE